MRFIDITGQQFGRLTAISKEKKNGRHAWLCECICGNRVVTEGQSLRSGRVLSCGCLRNERTSAANKTHGQSGGSLAKRSRTYSIWASMKTRCLNPACKDFPLYGAKGITVCKEWMKFDGFMADMGEAPIGMSIDRINSSLGYFNENCRWADAGAQGRNTSRNINLTIGGVTKCVQEWLRETGVTQSTFYYRRNHGWDDISAITTPPRGK